MSKADRDSPDACEGQDDTLLYPDVQLPISVIEADHITPTKYNVLTVVMGTWRDDTVELGSKVIVPKSSDVAERTIETPYSINVDAPHLDADMLRETLRFILADFFSPFEINEMMYITNAHKAR
jgi:hypothetical protein